MLLIGNDLTQTHFPLFFENNGAEAKRKTGKRVSQFKDV